jgi:hypothetical protein
MAGLGALQNVREPLRCTEIETGDRGGGLLQIL